MDYYKFINSKDIREHLIKISYKFTPEEALYVIHDSRSRTLDEKREAYKALVSENRGYKLKERRFEAFKGHTLESFVDAYLQNIDSFVEECKRPDDNAVYYAETYNPRDGWIDCQDLYGTFEECVSENCDEYCEKIKITKKFINTGKAISVTFLPNGTILDAQSSIRDDKVTDAFEMLYIEIPTPFRFGDIVKPIYEKAGDSKFHEPYEDVLVLTSLPHWDGEELKDCDPREVPRVADRAAYKRLRKSHLEEGDESDMLYAGYFLTDTSICCDHSVSGTYLDLEFYNDKLIGRGRILKALSSYLKNEIRLETLFALIKTVEAENTAKQIKEWYLDGMTDLLG